MNKVKNYLKDNSGITLVEILASLVIVSIVAVLSYNVLSQGFANQQRIQVETELRDEADQIMASLVKEVFLLKKMDIAVGTTCLKEDPENLNSTLYPYIKLKDEKIPPRPSSVSSTDRYFIGFDKDRVKLGWKYLELSNQNVSFIEADCDEKAASSIKLSKNQKAYTIKFSLKTLKGSKEHIMEFENTVQIIDNEKEVSEK